MKKIVLFFAILLSGVSFSQSINDYKYAIIPDKFVFLKNNNEYNLNVLTKSYFEKIGFQAFLESDNLPLEAMDKCNAVFISALENNSTFMTKIRIVVKDCKGSVLATSEEATTREKDYAVAYNEVFRKALISLDKLNYSYAPKVVSKVIATKPIENSVVSNAPIENFGIDTVIEKNTTQIAEVYSEMQTITNGFNFLNKKTKAVLNLMKTTSPYNFIAKSEDKSGIIFQKEDNWFFEYYQNGKLISEKIELKF
jgi:hypothetical protein